MSCSLSADAGGFSSVDTCLSESPCGWKFACTADKACIKNSTGIYDTREACLSAVSAAGKCPDRYQCSNNACVLNQLGPFGSLQQCQENTTNKCGWLWGCAVVTQEQAAADPANFDFTKQASRQPPNMPNLVADVNSLMCRYACSAGTVPLVIPAGGVTVSAAMQSVGYYASPAFVDIPIGSPFVAYKPFISVRCASTGTVNIPSGTGADLAYVQYVVMGYGNFVATGDQVDPERNDTMILAGAMQQGGRYGTPRTIPGLDATTGGDGMAMVGKQYRVFIRIKDMTDDDIVLTWPDITVTQADTSTSVTASSVTLYLPGSAVPFDLTRKETNPGNPETTGTVGGGTNTTPGNLLIPVSIPFRADKPYLQVRSSAPGKFTIMSTNYDTGGSAVSTSGTDTGAARFVLAPFGNVTPGKLDGGGSGAFLPILIGRESAAYPARGVATDIPALTGQDGNAVAEVGKYYRMYIRVSDGTDDMISVQWPTFTVTQTDAAGWTRTTVSGVPYPSTITSSDQTPCLTYGGFGPPGYAGQMYSADGKQRLFLDTDSKLKVQNVTTSVKRDVPSFTTANTSNTKLCMQVDGNLVSYDWNWGPINNSATNTATGGPWSLTLNNDGTLTVKGATGTTRWTG